MNFTLKLREDIERAAIISVAASAKELSDQGYDASGSGINSLRYEITNLGILEFQVNVYGKKYLIFLNDGTKPHHPPFNVIFEWVQDKQIGSSEKEQNSIAWAITKSIEQRGTPSPNSFKYSSNGRRLNWISFAIAEARKDIRPIFEGSDWAKALFDQILLQRT